MQSYDKAIAINPNFALAWSKRRFVLFLLKQYPESVEAYAIALTLDPNLAYAYEMWINRGLAQENLGRYADAVASYDKALIINPDSATEKQSRETARNKLT